LNNIKIRSALISDKVNLLHLEQQVIEAERPYNNSIKPNNAAYYDMDNLLTSERSKLVVAEHNNQIIGTGYVQIRESKKSLKHKQHGYLGFMYVDADFRGLGVNKQIMENLIEWAKIEGITDFYLDVYRDNDAAIRAYEKVGFTQSMVEMKLSVNE
jgi:GNAT superfamily N-acetyltransferase